MKNSEDSYALACDPAPGYEDRLFAAFNREIEAVEGETGLPWFQGYTTALFRVSLSVVRRELSIRCKTVDDLMPYLDWFRRVFCLGGICIDMDPDKLAHELIANAKARVVGRLAVMIGWYDDINDLIAEELTNVWRPLFVRMREEKAHITRFVREAREETQAYIASKGGNRIALHSIDDPLMRLYDEHELFFRPGHHDASYQKRTDERSLDALTALRKMLRTVFENRVQTQALNSLPVRAKAIPSMTAVGFETKIITTVRDHWVLTQMLLAAADADLHQEVIPWNALPLFLRIDSAMTVADLVEAFWKRMERRAETSEERNCEHHRLTLQALIESKATIILRDAAEARAGRLGGGLELVFIMSPVEESSEKDIVATRAKLPLVETADAWRKRYLRPDLDSSGIERAATSIEKLALEQVQLLTIVLEPFWVVAEERNRLLDSETWSELYRAIVPSLLHRFLTSKGSVWSPKAMSALLSLTEGWCQLDTQQGKFLRQLAFINEVRGPGLEYLSESTFSRALLSPSALARTPYERQVVTLLSRLIDTVKDAIARSPMVKPLFDEVQLFLREHLEVYTRILLRSEAKEGVTRAQIREEVKKQIRKNPWLIPIQPSFRPRPADLKRFEMIVDQLTQEPVVKTPSKKAKKPVTKPLKKRAKP